MIFKEEYSMDRGFSKKWGTSLMMPEHRESLNKLRMSLEKTDKPILDEQHQEYISLNLYEALYNNSLIEITTHHNGFHEKQIGHLTAISAQNHQVTLRNDEDQMTINFNDIVDANSVGQ